MKATLAGRYREYPHQPRADHRQHHRERNRSGRGECGFQAAQAIQDSSKSRPDEYEHERFEYGDREFPYGACFRRTRAVNTSCWRQPMTSPQVTTERTPDVPSRSAAIYATHEVKKLMRMTS